MAGGLRIGEPAADLAVAAALVSSLTGAPLPADAVYFGEASLTGAVRQVAQAAARLKEAAKLGFARAVLPSGGLDGVDAQVSLQPVGSLAELVAAIAACAPRRPAMRDSRGGGERDKRPRAVEHAEWAEDEAG